MTRRIATASLLLLLAASARGAEPAGLRLLQVGKDHAVLRVELSQPATAAVRWGEQPGDWSGSSKATSPADVHELRMTGLSPDRRYFYEVEIDGAPAGSMATFQSGRSWVTRRAVILAAAAAPSPHADSAALADRLFARESDALVLLGGAGDESAFRQQHARAMSDRVVVTGPQDAPWLAVADVVLAWSGESLAEGRAQQGACWSVALGAPAPGADVVLTAGAPSGLAVEGDRLTVTLAGHDSVALQFASGELTATLRRGDETLTRTLVRACTVPPPVETASEYEANMELNADGEAHETSCDLP